MVCAPKWAGVCVALVLVVLGFRKINYNLDKRKDGPVEAALRNLLSKIPYFHL